MESLYKRRMIKGLLVLITLCLLAVIAGVYALDYTSVKAHKSTLVINNVNDRTIMIDSQPDYLQGVSVSGGKGRVRLSADSSKINMRKPGTYSIIYTAKDKQGQVVMRKAKVKVVKPKIRKVVYLTFDDGPSFNTPKILKILKQYHVKATFFVTGQEPAYFKYIRKADQQGCCIGAHSYTHQFSIYRSEATYFNDLNSIEKVIQHYIGHRSRLVRFPGGSSNTISRHYAYGMMSRLTKDLLNRGYQYVDWNVDSTDASGNHVPVNQLIRNATDTSLSHVCILMHDAGAKRTTVQALGSIIQSYRQRGYTFDTLDHAPYVFHHHINN